MKQWDDARFVAFDFETSGTLREYALQPWRVAQGKSRVTSLAIAQLNGDQVVTSGGLDPSVDMMRQFLQSAVDRKQYIVGWNVVFDIQWLMAYGLEDLCFKAKWLDGCCCGDMPQSNPNMIRTEARKNPTA